MNEGEFIWMALGVIALLAGIALAVKKLWPGREPPLERDLATMARQADLEKIKRVLPELATKEEIRELERHLDRKRSVSIANIYVSINSINERMAGVETHQRSQDQWLKSMDGKLDALVTREIGRLEGGRK